MKVIGILWKSALFITLILCLGGLKQVQAQGFRPIVLGEFCWQVLITEDQDGPVTENPIMVRAVLTYLGGKHFTLQGTAEMPNGDRPPVFGGSGMIIGNGLIFTVSIGQEHSLSQWVDMGVAQIRLDLATLSGTIVQTRLDFDRTNREFEQCYGAGTLTFMPCP